MVVAAIVITTEPARGIMKPVASFARASLACIPKSVRKLKFELSTPVRFGATNVDCGRHNDDSRPDYGSADRALSTGNCMDTAIAAERNGYFHCSGGAGDRVRANNHRSGIRFGFVADSSGHRAHRDN